MSENSQETRFCIWPQCNQPFESDQELNRHNAIFHPSCPQCNNWFPFTNVNRFQKHWWELHLDPDHPLRGRLVFIALAQPHSVGLDHVMVICPFCQAGFGSERQRMCHWEWEECNCLINRELVAEYALDYSMECLVAGERFVESTPQGTNFRCQACEFKAETAWKMLEHMEGSPSCMQHKDNLFIWYGFLCWLVPRVRMHKKCESPGCLKRFGNDSDMERHIRDEHGGSVGREQA